MCDGLLLLRSDGGGALTHSGLIQGLACGSYSGDERLLHSLRGSRDDLSHDVVHLPLSDGGGMLLIDREVGCAARHSRQDGGG
jgi:hypothetical protein